MASVAFLARWVQSLLGDRQLGISSLALVRLLWYVAALALTPGRRTLRRMQTLVGSCPTDRHGVERLLKEKPDATRQILLALGHQRLAAVLAKKRRKRIHVLVDTTNNRRFGKHMEGAFKFRDNTTSGYIVGHRLVVAIAVVGKSLIPLGGRLFIREQDAQRLGTKYLSQIDLAEELIKGLPEMPPGVQVEVLGDSFFFCAQIVKACRERNYVLTSRAQTNQTVTGPGAGRRTTVGKKMKRLFARRQAKPVTVKVRHRTRTFLVAQRQHAFRKIGLINTVYSKEKGKKRDPIALVTTDLAATPKEVIERMGHRWAIELFFRSCKQDLGMGHYQGRHWEGVDQHLQLVLIAHLLLSCAGSHKLPDAGRTTKGDTLSGLHELKAGKAALRQALAQDLVGEARTPQALKLRLKRHVDLMYGT